jgi:hypothetical protein
MLPLVKKFRPNEKIGAKHELRGAQAAGLSVVGWLGRQLSRSELSLACS